jgi:hypothetical protein
VILVLLNHLCVLYYRVYIVVLKIIYVIPIYFILNINKQPMKLLLAGLNMLIYSIKFIPPCGIKIGEIS